MNDGLLALEEEVVLLDHQHGMEQATILNLNCCARSAVLAMKPIYGCLDNLPSQLVRLSHCLQSGRTTSKYIAGLRKVVKESFHYVRVHRLTDDCVGHRQRSAGILKASRAAQDMTENIEVGLLNALNGDWRDEELHHFCLGEWACPLKCTNEKSSLELVTSLVVNAMGGSDVCALAV